MTRVSLIVAHDEGGVIAVDGPHEARAVVELTVAVTATADAARAAGGV